MAKRIRKAVKLGTQLAIKAKEKLEKELKLLMKAGMIDKKEYKRLFKAFLEELKAEKERIKAFAKQEIKREMGKARKHAKPILKKAVKRYKR